jgi:hypothetical protein
MTTLAIVLGALGSVLAARGRLASDTGSYWWAWSFRAKPLAAIAAQAELVFWPALAGASAATTGKLGADAFGAGSLPQSIAAIMLGVGAGAAFLLTSRKAPGADPGSVAMAGLVRRQDERLDRLAHEGINDWLSGLGVQALQAVARETLKRLLTRYGEPGQPTVETEAAKEAAKVTFVEARIRFQNNPDDSDVRDSFENLILDVIRERRISYSRRRRRRFEALG